MPKGTYQPLHTVSPLPSHPDGIVRLVRELIPASEQGVLLDRLTQAVQWGLVDIGNRDDVIGAIERLAASLVEQRRVADGQARFEISETIRPAGHVVYYVRFEELVKIGTSASLSQRLRQIPCDELLGTEPGDRQTESIRHRQFRDLHVVGEWFKDDLRLREHIQSLTA